MTFPASPDTEYYSLDAPSDDSPSSPLVSSPPYNESLALLSRCLTSTVNGRTHSADAGGYLDGNTSEYIEDPLLESELHDLTRQSTSSTSQAILNTINVLVGLGILAYPYALKNTGWTGILFMIFILLVTRHTAHLLGRCLEAHPYARSIPDLARAAFGYKMELFIGFIFFLELFLACASYLILQADNLMKIFPNVLTRYEWIILVTLLVLPTTWTADFRWLSYLSIFGIIASVFLLFVLIIHGLAEPEAPGSILHPSDTILFDPYSFPIAFGIVMSGFSGHSVFPSIYESMHNPQEYYKVVNISYWCTGFIYILMAITGYLMFGDQVQKEITLNLPHSFLSVIATWMTIVNPATKFAITLFPMTINIESIILNLFFSRTKELTHQVKILIRTLTVLFILILALFVPYFDRILEFIGSLCSFTVSLTFPCLCVLVLLKDKLAPSERYLNIALAVSGVMFTLLGSFVAVYGPL